MKYGCMCGTEEIYIKLWSYDDIPPGLFLFIYFKFPFFLFLEIFSKVVNLEFQSYFLFFSFLGNLQGPQEIQS
jgi:hypothetical protein